MKVYKPVLGPNFFWKRLRPCSHTGFNTQDRYQNIINEIVTTCAICNERDVNRTTATTLYVYYDYAKRTYRVERFCQKWIRSQRVPVKLPQM